MIYVGDFGEVQIVPSRLMRSRDLLIVDPTKVEVAYYQKMKQVELAKTGHSDKRMVSTEYMLRTKAEVAHGLIADLS